jgi:hypothetical protein
MSLHAFPAVAGAIVLLALLTPPAHAAAPQFGPPDPIATAPGVTGAIAEPEAGDVSGDGITDVVVPYFTWPAAHVTHPLGIYLGDGEGGLTNGSSLFDGPAPRTEAAREIVIEDFNGDGHNDIFVADHGYDADPFPGYPNSLALSNPQGKLVDASANLPTESGFSHSADAADIDGDGDLDIFVGNLGGGDGTGPEILLNDGTGQFVRGAGLLPAAQEDWTQNVYTKSLFVDVNGDGAPDLFLGGDQSTQSELLLNDGTGQFAAVAGAIPAKALAPTAITIALGTLDVNRDDDPDLILGFTGSDPFYVGRRLQVLVGNGDGTFADETSTRLPTQTSGDNWPHSIRVADLDGDGRSDFGVPRWPAGTDTAADLYVDDGTGVFQLRPAGDPAAFFSFLDADLDGYPDLFSTRPGNPEPHVVQLQVTDEDGDGVADKTDNCPTVANADQANGDADALGNACDSNAAPPHFGPTRTVASLNPGNVSLLDHQTGDVNDDGFTDVVMTHFTYPAEHVTHPVRVLLGNGQGGFTDGSSIFAGPAPSAEWGRQTLVEDFNGDGQDDIFVADHGYDAPPFPGHPNALALSRSDGKLEDASSNLPASSGFSHSTAAADVDGDDDLDIFVGNVCCGDTPPELLLNDGSGHFTRGVGMLPAAVEQMWPRKYTRSLFVNANGDSAPDLILGADAGPASSSEVLLNDGTGQFTILPGALPPKKFGPDGITTALETLDVNRDGLADLIAGYTTLDPSYVGRRLQILISNGDGTFQDRTASRLPVQDQGDAWPYAIRVADVNADGRDDFGVAYSNYPNTPTPLYIDDGSGVYRIHSTKGAQSGLSIFDANSDGRPDLFSSFGTPNAETHNLQLGGARLLTVTTSGSGTVTTSPAGISCPPDCTEAFDQGTQLTITAHLASGWQFGGWGGACAPYGTNLSCQGPINNDGTVPATFTLLPAVTPPAATPAPAPATGTAGTTPKKKKKKKKKKGKK